MKVAIYLSFCILSITLLGGCVNLKPRPDQTRIFTLAADVANVFSQDDAPECYVTRVELPGYLEGNRIHYRGGAGVLETVPGARWAEALAEALPRAIALHLQSTGMAKVRAHYPWANRMDQAVEVSVQFQRFSANATGQVEVVAHWQLRSRDGSVREGLYAAPGLIWERQKGAGAAEYVAQLDAALAGLTAVIAQELSF
jgi:uncharacterized lipoprotein YmbA